MFYKQMCRSSHGLTQAEINLYTISLDLHTLGGVRQINKDIKTTALKSLRVQTDFCRFCLAVTRLPCRGAVGGSGTLIVGSFHHAEVRPPDSWNTEEMAALAPFVGGAAAKRRPATAAD